MITTALFTLTALTATITAATCRPSPRCPNENGCTTTTDNGAIYQLQCFTDYNGPIIGVTQSSAFWDCASACSTTNSCTAFNFKNEFCYLLGANVGTGRTGNAIVAGVMTKAPTTSTPLGRQTCGNQINCEAASTDGCAYKVGINTFIVRCNMDYYGSDFAIASTDDLAECIQQCTTTQGCKSVSWSTGTCYMKNSIPQGKFSQWVQGAYLE